MVKGGVTKESTKTDPHKVSVHTPSAESTHVSAAYSHATGPLVN